MKFKNFNNVEYTVNYHKPSVKFHASGLCDSPDTKNPQILVDPTLLTRRQLNVLIEEVLRDIVIIFDMYTAES